jgi:hypothetical protein
MEDKLVVHVPHHAVRLEFKLALLDAFIGDKPAIEMMQAAPFDDTVEAVDERVEEIVLLLATMLALTGESFAIFEDHSYMIGDEYYENASGRLELDEYIYIHFEK